MNEPVPFTMKERREISQHTFGHRPLCDWGEGDLPAPFAAGDVLWLPPATRMGSFEGRLKGMPPGQHFLVDTAFSVDEGDGWYFRVTPEVLEEGRAWGSDRLHVFSYGRSDVDEDIDYMAPFVMVDTADPEGLARRNEMIAAGWRYEPGPCPCCGRGADQ